MRDDLKKAGMSKEDEAFYQIERKLLARKRAERDAEREAQRKEALKNEHWMRCPKCGHEMVEEKGNAVTVDVCTHCKGVFFDHGELELMIEAVTPDGIFTGFKRFLSGD